MNACWRKLQHMETDIWKTTYGKQMETEDLSLKDHIVWQIPIGLELLALWILALENANVSLEKAFLVQVGSFSAKSSESRKAGCCIDLLLFPSASKNVPQNSTLPCHTYIHGYHIFLGEYDLHLTHHFLERPSAELTMQTFHCSFPWEW